ncbi:hypothetical protein FRC08_014722 [Ceratobasidium sp. 394]|nr:hypothetical protein FRC08_014722 [Ceratobasidium sp. 394]
MSNNLANLNAAARPYYIATYKGRQAAIKRDADYQTTIKLVQKSIPNLRSAKVQDIFISTTLADYGDGLTLISEEIWPEVVGHVKNVEVTLEDESTVAVYAPLGASGIRAVTTLPKPMNPVTHGTRNKAAPRRASDNTAINSSGPIDSVSVTVRTASHRILKFGDLPVSTRIKDIKSRIEVEHGIPAALQSFDLFGASLDDIDTLKQSSVARSKYLELSSRTRRTMIYLFAPSNHSLLNVQVKLCLDYAWELAALCPSAEVSDARYVQSVFWAVDVDKNGRLIDRNSQKELSCLTWDSLSTKLPAAVSSPSSDHLVKQPAPLSDLLRPIITVEPDNSVVLSTGNARSYLCDVFKISGFEHSSDFLE